MYLLRSKASGQNKALTNLFYLREFVEEQGVEDTLDRPETVVVDEAELTFIV